MDGMSVLGFLKSVYMKVRKSLEIDLQLQKSWRKKIALQLSEQSNEGASEEQDAAVENDDVGEFIIDFEEFELYHG